MKVFYFGAWGGPGHRIWTPSGGAARTAGPWTDRDLDAPSYTRAHRAALPTGRGFVPVDGDEPQGVWQVTRGADKSGATWTALGCYDRTQDARKGSISVFVAEGEHDEGAMKGIAARHFPAVWTRIHGRPS